MTKSMASVNIDGQMEGNMLDFGRMENNTDMENT
jgi:hypothetical protein